ncbi:MAG: heme-binding domain-containing protein [Deltaproteobacteria bacterium]|nr:heme-binding domain-containing protein [Deltaproteobacteria bacterium]
MKIKLTLIAVALVVFIQVIPYGKNHQNPPVLQEPAWSSPVTRSLFMRACGDCHSHETLWPWYSKIAPVSWLVQNDTFEGREHFNVSAWGVQAKNKGNEAAASLREGEMPPWFYLLPHPEARLSKAEEAELVKGLVVTFGEKQED